MCILFPFCKSHKNCYDFGFNNLFGKKVRLQYFSEKKENKYILFFFQGAFTLSNIVTTSVLASCKSVLLSQSASNLWKVSE